MAAAIDLIAPAGQALRALHLGGGALTLPRYVAATRPGSAQRVVEIDGPLVELVRRSCRCRRKPPFGYGWATRARPSTGMREAGYDVIVGDVFAGARTPAHLASVEFLREVARVLDPAGWLIANVADGPPLRYARAQVATIRAALPAACLVADAAVLRGRRFGNLVVLAGRTPPPTAELTRRAAGDWFPGRVEIDLDRFAGGAAAVTDATAGPTPVAAAGPVQLVPVALAGGPFRAENRRRLPADVVSLWSLRPGSSRTLGVALWALPCCCEHAD